MDLTTEKITIDLLHSSMGLLKMAEKQIMLVLKHSCEGVDGFPEYVEFGNTVREALGSVVNFVAKHTDDIETKAGMETLIELIQAKTAERKEAVEQFVEELSNATD